MATCAICLSSDGYSCEQTHSGVGDGARYDCAVCGSFIVTGSAQSGALASKNGDLSKVMRAVLSHRIALANRNLEGRDEIPKITSYTISQLFDEKPRLPSPGRQAINAIRFVGEYVIKEMEPISNLPPSFHSLIGSPHRRASEKIVRELMDRGVLTGIPVETMQHPDEVIDVDLSLAGWDAFESELRGQVSGSYGFIALKFGDEELDEFLIDVIKPAVLQLGYTLEDMRDASSAGIIDNVMRAKIRDAAFVLVDLTHGNKGAYWEAGYAEGLGKPVLYLCKQEVFDSEGTHFDTNHCTTVKWTPGDREPFTTELVATLRRSLGLF